MTTNRLHQRRAGPCRIWLGGLRIERCPLLRVELRIVHGILLLSFVVVHRLFSLRSLGPLSPQRTKTIGPRIRSYSMRTNLRHTGVTTLTLTLKLTLTLNHSLEPGLP